MRFSEILDIYKYLMNNRNKIMFHFMLKKCLLDY